MQTNIQVGADLSDIASAWVLITTAGLDSPLDGNFSILWVETLTECGPDSSGGERHPSTMGQADIKQVASDHLFEGISDSVSMAFFVVTMMGGSHSALLEKS